MMNKWLRLLIWIVGLQLIGFAIGQLTAMDMSWYSGLTQSSLNPPRIVFPIAWSFLYGLLAIMGWLLWEKRKNSTSQGLLNLYFAQLIVNWLWTPLFFTGHFLGFSFLWILLLVCLNSLLMLLCLKRDRLIALLLTPYLAWLLFAAYLNGYIWWNN